MTEQDLREKYGDSFDPDGKDLYSYTIAFLDGRISAFSEAAKIVGKNNE